jgi:hypothetical protein
MAIKFIQIRKKLYWGGYGAFQTPVTLEEFIKKYPERDKRLEIIIDLERTRCTDEKGFLIAPEKALKLYEMQEDDMVYNLCETADDYQGYLLDFPKGINRQRAEEKMAELSFDIYVTIEDFEKYLKDKPLGKYKQYAEKKLDELYYIQTITSKNKKDYEIYLDKFPQGIHRADVEESLDALLQEQCKTIDELEKYLSLSRSEKNKTEGKKKLDILYYQFALKEDTEDAFHLYLKKFPSGFHREAIIQKLSQSENGMNQADIQSQKDISTSLKEPAMKTSDENTLGKVDAKSADAKSIKAFSQMLDWLVQKHKKENEPQEIYINYEKELHGLIPSEDEGLSLLNTLQKLNYIQIGQKQPNTEAEYRIILKDNFFYYLQTGGNQAHTLKKLLYLHSNPSDSDSLSFDREQACIGKYLSNHADFYLYPFKTHLDVISLEKELQKAYRDGVDFVHISCPIIQEKTLLLEDKAGWESEVDMLKFQRILHGASFMYQYSKLPCIFLSGANSEKMAEMCVTQNYFEFAIGMKEEPDRTKVFKFIRRFYRYLSEGQDISTAFQWSMFRSETQAPTLFKSLVNKASKVARL